MDDGDHRPVPDPTVLTTASIYREITMLEERLGIRVDADLRLILDKLTTIELQRVEQKADTGKAVAAALAAVNKQLDLLAENFTTTIGGLADNVVDVKERVVKIESLKLGGQLETAERRSSTTVLTAVIGACGTILVIAITVVGFIVANKP